MFKKPTAMHRHCLLAMPRELSGTLPSPSQSREAESPGQEGPGFAGPGPEKAMEITRGLEYLCCEDRTRELGLFNLKKRLQKELFVAIQY